MLNIVVASGVLKSPALRYDHNSKPEFRFTLEQAETSADGRTFTLYLPCCASAAAAERLASDLEEGQQIVVTSGRLCYRKRMSKGGTEQSRLEILVWQAERLSGSPRDERNEPGEDDSMSVAPEINLSQSGAPEPGPGHKTRKRALPKHLQREWHPADRN